MGPKLSMGTTPAGNGLSVRGSMMAVFSAAHLLMYSLVWLLKEPAPLQSSVPFSRLCSVSISSVRVDATFSPCAALAAVPDFSATI